MSETDDQKLDIWRRCSPPEGDSRRPPDWWGRALLYTVIAVFAAIFVWTSWGKISTIVLDVVISIFIALAVEPLVVSMVRHGWKRGLASAVSLIGLAVIVMALLTLFGNMFVQQLIAMVKRPAVDLYTADRATAVKSVHESFDTAGDQTASACEILKNVQTSWVTDFAGHGPDHRVSGLFTFLLNLHDRR